MPFLAVLLVLAILGYLVFGPLGALIGVVLAVVIYGGVR